MYKSRQYLSNKHRLPQIGKDLTVFVYHRVLVRSISGQHCNVFGKGLVVWDFNGQSRPSPFGRVVDGEIEYPSRHGLFPAPLRFGI
jgi:hypothetical protein